MRFNNIFHEPTYRKVAQAFAEHGHLIIERVPDALDVSTFFDTISTHSKLPLSDRFYFSPRDGTIAVYHHVAHNLVVSLLNVTQDYTYRCTDTFIDGWRGHFTKGARSSVRDPQLLQTVIPMFDDLQRYILCTSPSYLHQIRQDIIIDPEFNNRVTVYTVEVAHRYRMSDDAPPGYVDMTGWPFMNDYRRRRATPAQITVWAMLTITPTDAKLDPARLDAIGRGIRAASSMPNDPPVLLPPGSLLSLLRVRHAEYMDGRARYALVRAVVTSRALLRHNVLLSAPSDYGPRLLEDEQELPETTSNVVVIVKVVGANLLSASLGLLYLLRLFDPEANEEEVVGVAFAIISVLLPLTMAIWLRVFTGSVMISSLLRLRRRITAEEMYRMTEGKGPRLRVQAATSAAAREHYDGRWLSFSGLHYEQGGKEYPGRFDLEDLLRAGYQTTVAMDGREVLISPCGERRMRMHDVDAKGIASFIKGWKEELRVQDDNAEKGMEVLPCSRAIWSANVSVK